MWLQGKKCAVILTFDFDAESLFLEGKDVETTSPTKLSQGEYGGRVGVPRILEWLEKRQLPATFFVPGVTAEKYPHLVECMVMQGLEIAHHGYTHAEPLSMTPEQERADIQKGTDALQRLTGKKPIGYRAPSWAPTHHTLPILEEMGFLYDASLIGDERPYIAPGTKSLIEVPSDWCLDDAPHYFFNFSPQYRTGLSAPSKVLEIWKDEFDGIYDAGGCFVLAMHPQFTGRSHRMKALDAMVSYMMEHDVWITTMEEAALYWKDNLLER